MSLYLSKIEYDLKLQEVKDEFIQSDKDTLLREIAYLRLLKDRD